MVGHKCGSSGDSHQGDMPHIPVLISATRPNKETRHLFPLLLHVHESSEVSCFSAARGGSVLASIPLD